MTILVSGVAGFIGFHVASALMAKGADVLGLDCFTPYYDRRLKEARLADLGARYPSFRFEAADVADGAALAQATRGLALEAIVHLAAQPGVRYSLENPFAYVRSNLEGHMSILELCRALLPELRHLVYASSSSVYGANHKVPFAVQDLERTELSRSLIQHLVSSGYFQLRQVIHDQRDLSGPERTLHCTARPMYLHFAPGIDERTFQFQGQRHADGDAGVWNRRDAVEG